MKICCNENGAKRSKGGFALVEVMVSIFILGTTVVSLYGSYSFGFAVLKLAQENIRADQILVQKLETLRLYDWSKTAPGGGYLPATFTDSFAPGSSSPGATYSGTMAISGTPVAESYSSTLRQVTVTLGWISGGISRSRSMTTFVSQYGIETLAP